jgi:plastocyanin
VTRPPGASSELNRSGTRSTSTEPQEGQTRGFWSRSAPIRISASGARYSLMPRRPTVGPSGGYKWHESGFPTLSKCTEILARAQRLFFGGNLEIQMLNIVKTAVCSLVFLISSATFAVAQRVHEIRMDANPAKEVYRFSPAQVTARPGDVLLFKVASGSPHSIVFEGTGLSETGRAALSRRSADLSSPLLTAEGAEYRIVVPAIAPGTYSFFCLPHRAYDMRGQLQVTK